MYCEVIVEITHERVGHQFTYAVPPGMTLVPGQRVLIPFGKRVVEGYVLSLREDAGGICNVREVIRPLEGYPVILPELMDLAQWVAKDTHCLPVEALRLMIPAQMRGGRIHEKQEEMAYLTYPEQFDEAINAQKRSEKRREILKILKNGEQSAPVLRKISAQGLSKLVEDGWVTLQLKETLRKPHDVADFCMTEHMPTPEQQNVLDELLPAVRESRGKFLLHGVTGSGKTEVFLHAVREALKMGKAAIVLVPEIALTPQMVGWFRSRFGDMLAVLHSRLSAGERYDEWRRIRRGEARVVVGARSAVFAPTENLGIIIIDEEHEQTYLADSHPRYDAREVAQRRCEYEGAVLLLASATPSLKSFARTLPTLRSSLGPLTLLELPHRVMNRPMPDIEIVDMREELLRGNRGILSGRLDKALRECLTQKSQAMLFINRRGYSTFVSCRTCGKSIKCPHCDISMTYHRNPEKLRCHYCGEEMSPPSVCPFCGSDAIRFFGMGTQKVEETLKKRFPSIRTLRMDVDTTQEKDAHAKILSAFRRGEADVLIGTQMITKGLDFPQVTLVGVVAADATLNLPDYRSSERTFSLIVQVAGRAGRDRLPGKVIVQTYEPENYCIEAAARQDFRAFFETEFERRRYGLYPPFTRMVRILVEQDTEEAARKTAEMLGAQFDLWLQEHKELDRQIIQTRVMEAPVKLIRGKNRWQVFFKLYTRGPTDQILEQLETMTRQAGEGVYLEVDPANML